MYKQKDFQYILGTEGFSDDLLKNHFKLYGGYVTNTNTLIEKLKTEEKGTPEYAELKRRFGWEYNGMRLHELYFDNITKDANSPGENLSRKLSEQFGSFDAWVEDFKATGSMRGIGWVLLCYDKNRNRAQIDADSTQTDADDDVENGGFFNVWIDEHNTGHLAGATPLLVMDVFEHAFILDYGMNRANYIDSFMKAVDWGKVERRLAV